MYVIWSIIKLIELSIDITINQSFNVDVGFNEFFKRLYFLLFYIKIKIHSKDL